MVVVGEQSSVFATTSVWSLALYFPPPCSSDGLYTAISILGDVQSLTGQSPEHPSVIWPCFEQQSCATDLQGSLSTHVILHHHSPPLCSAHPVTAVTHHAKNILLLCHRWAANEITPFLAKRSSHCVRHGMDVHQLAVAAVNPTPLQGLSSDLAH